MSKMEKKFSDFLKKKEGEEKKRNIFFWIFAVIGTLVAIGGIAYLVYRFMKPDRLEELEDDFDDEFDYDDDFFDDEDDLDEDVVDDTVE